MALHIGVNIGLRGCGRGWMGSFPEPYIDLWSLLRISPQQDTEEFTDYRIIIPHSTVMEKIGCLHVIYYIIIYYILEANWKQSDWKCSGNKSVKMKKRVKKEIESCLKTLKEWRDMLLC